MLRFPPFFALLACVTAIPMGAAEFRASASSVPVYDFVEVEVRTRASQGNPFIDAQLTGELRHGESPAISGDGFCDSPDGSVFRIRFMATRPGDY
jgi:hypothetical protein